MKLFNIFKKTENPMFKKLEKVISFQVKEAFYAFGFVFTDKNLATFKTSLKADKLFEFKEKCTFDVDEDNIEVFFVNNNQNIKYVILLVDYYEPLRKEYLFEKILIENYPIIELKKIFPL